VSDRTTRAHRRRRKRQQRLRLKEEGVWYPRGFWPAFAAPATIWMALLFITPFYAVFAVAMGTVDPIFRNPVPVWQPWYWDTSQIVEVFGKIFGTGGQSAIFAPAFIRTFENVFAASALCLILGYPVAYFVARHSGKRKNLVLLLLIAPFWISYMMRMLAWVNILQPDGYLNMALAWLPLDFLPIANGHFGWLEGHQATVVFGIIYGYIPYMILPLFAGLDRIPQSLLEASRDLGASAPRTFFRITLPLSKPGILAGLVIVMLPMFGDYYTNNLLSRRPTTSMIGNLIDNNVGVPSRVSEAAVLVLFLAVILIVPMSYYLRTTSRQEASD